MAEIQNNSFVEKGKYTTTYGTEGRKIYTVWRDMFRRCYENSIQNKNPTYKSCKVIKEWNNFQVFAEWYKNNYIEGFQLDKDILVKGNKIYSPETCCFVPHEINSLFTKKGNKRGNCLIGVTKRKRGKPYEANIRKCGKNTYLGIYFTEIEAFQAYKQAKEQHIKEVTEKWKDQINPIVYKAMQEYQVEITD